MAHRLGAGIKMGWIGGGAAAMVCRMELRRKKRVAIDARWVFRELSGIGRYTLELLRQLGESGGEFDYVVVVGDSERRAFGERGAGLAGRANFSFAERPFGPC